MQTKSNSVLKLSAIGCVLAAMLFPDPGSLRAAETNSITTQQRDITGTWDLSIRYTGGDDRSTYELKRGSGPAKGKDVSLAAPATNPVGQWMTARFISSRVVEPRPGNLSFILKQEGEKVTGTYSAPSGRQKVSGTVKGKDVSFGVAVTNDAGEQITGRFTGVVLSSGKMEGTVTFDLKSFFNDTIGPGPAKIQRRNSANETDADQKI